MEAGKYNRRIAIQTKTTTFPYDNGEPIDAWADDFYMFAGIVTSGGTEFYAAQKINAATTSVFKVRHTEQLTTLNRIRYGSLYFHILGINSVDAMRKDLYLSCKEVV